MTDHNLGQVRDVLARVAADAGRLLMDIYASRDFAVTTKEDGSPVTGADIRAQELILSSLLTHFPNIPIVSEELGDSLNLEAMHDRFFIVDPLDSTKNFITGIPFFDVSIALVHQGRSVVGVVHDPVHQITYSAARGAGALRNTTPIRVRSCSSLSVADLDINATKLANNHYRTVALEIAPRAKKVRYFGSAVLETCWIAAGALDGMLNHKLSVWDIAAVSLVLEEAGGHWGDLDGAPYRLDTIDRRPFLACGDRKLFEEIAALLFPPA